MKNFVLFVFTLSFVSAENSVTQEFINANNQFAQSVYKQLSKTDNENFLVSPFSAETILALAQSGSKEETTEELRKVLYLPNDKNKIESAIKSLLPKFKGNDLYTLQTANKIYVKKDFSIKDEFKNVANTVYHADIEPIDFARSVEAANKINSWVEKQTNNKIKNLIDSNNLDDHTRAILINSLYFKSNWSNPFPLSDTEKRNFYKTPTETVNVDTMLRYEKYFNYYESSHLKAQILELPFQGDEASMVFVLPNDRDGLEKLENDLDKVFELQNQLKYAYLNVALPKFKIETRIDFKTVLKNLGLKKVFNASEADLSGIAGKKGELYISEVAQKTFIDVSEEGVEAAAATYEVYAHAAILLREQPKNFIADHPFIFYIKVNNVIIFVGRVTDPTKS